ncbi:MAG: sigma-70 family RNA polymerase sigma factor [Erythrobacter sp.]|uniref:sigma-70 family RNA polymerase sigma factor n=1 Tax=Erythrobacter sp. TaxID=1042 RepID=UPI00260976AC|nr:sigma-70 family RNA polymerase sigma factor [Erythrobacter sp.]MDJ0979168.1 sigma-70 family RNA polymerase sigma factor [Erythrobacter sp.]
MKHDPSSFGAPYAPKYAHASRDVVEDRVRRFMPLVRRSAWHIYGMGRPEYAGALEVEDLIQTGVMALTECAQKHDGPTEDGFAAYAKIRVRGAMLDQIRRLLNDSRSARKKRAAYDAAAHALRGRLGREPSRAEIAQAMGISDSDLLEIEASAITVTSIAEEYDETSTAFAADGLDPFDVLSEMENRERLIAAMQDLPERLTLVLQLFYVEELNLTEIAQVLEVSVPRVHQLRAKALKDLKKLMEAEG